MANTEFSFLVFAGTTGNPQIQINNLIKRMWRKIIENYKLDVVAFLDRPWKIDVQDTHETKEDFRRYLDMFELVYEDGLIVIDFSDGMELDDLREIYEEVIEFLNDRRLI